MLKFIGKRLVSAVLLMLLVTSVVYLLVSSNGMGIARMLVGKNGTQQQVVDKYLQLGLDRPIILQYVSWLGRAIRVTSEPATSTASTSAPCSRPGRR